MALDVPLTGRLPAAESSPLDDDQATLACQLHRLAVPWAEQAGFAGTDDEGHLIGPWNVLVHRPALANGFNAWVLAEQTYSSLTPTVRETVILTVSVAWSAPYAIYSHTAAARTAGLSDDAIGDLLEPPARDHLSADEFAAHRFADELVRTHAVTSASYDRAVSAFGTAGVIDLTHLVGIYLGTCALLGAFGIPAPDQPAS